MTAGRLIFPGYMPAEDANGDRIGGARAYFYEDGTSTAADTYTAEDLTTSHGAYVEADSVGVWPAMWADTTSVYSVALTDAEGIPLPKGTWSGVRAAIDAALASADLAESAQLAAETAKTDALAAQTAAETARGLAEAAADDAQAVADTFTDLDAQLAAAQAAADAAAASALEAAAFDPTNYALKATTITGGGLVTGGGAISGDRILTVTAATQAQVLAKTSAAVVLTPANIEDLMAETAALAIAL